MLTSVAHVFVGPLKSEGFVEHILSHGKCKLDREECPELCLKYLLANIELMEHCGRCGAHLRSYGQAQPLRGLIDQSLAIDRSMVKITCIILGWLGRL